MKVTDFHKVPTSSDGTVDLCQEWLSDKDKADWLRVRSKVRIDFGLNQFYASLKLPGEEYSTVFCLVSKELYWRKNGMKVEAGKLSRKMKEGFPRAAALVGKQIESSAARRKIGKRGRCHITHREVETVKAWIRNALKN